VCVKESFLLVGEKVVREKTFFHEKEVRTSPVLNLTPILIGMHGDAPLSPMERVPGCTTPMKHMAMAHMAPMHIAEQTRALWHLARETPEHGEQAHSL
jgi:hypothetical protein